jgi:hypothetical protein
VKRVFEFHDTTSCHVVEERPDGVTNEVDESISNIAYHDMCAAFNLISLALIP